MDIKVVDISKEQSGIGPSVPANDAPIASVPLADQKPTTSNGSSNQLVSYGTIATRLINLFKERLPEEPEEDKVKRFERLNSLMAKIIRNKKEATVLIEETLEEAEKITDKALMRNCFKDFVSELKYNIPEKIRHGKVYSDSKLQLSKKEARLRNKKIKALKKKLRVSYKRYVKYESSELSLDDLDKAENSHMKSYKMARRITKLVSDMKALEGKAFRTGREMHRKLDYKGSEYPEINEAITELVNHQHMYPYNSSKSYNLVYSMPSIDDISDIVEKVILDKKLTIPDVAGLCKTIKLEVGNEIKKRRTSELDAYNAALLAAEHIRPVEVEDQTVLDDRDYLEELFDSNKKEYEQKLNSILVSYAQKSDTDATDTDTKEDQLDDEELDRGEKRSSGDEDGAPKSKKIKIDDEENGDDDDDDEDESDESDMSEGDDGEEEEEDDGDHDDIDEEEDSKDGVEAEKITPAELQPSNGEANVTEDYSPVTIVKIADVEISATITKPTAPKPPIVVTDIDDDDGVICLD